MSASTSIGPVSGIDYGTLVNGLTAVDQATINSITARINNLNNQDTALTTLNTLMTGLKVSAASFTSSAIFRATNATSANPSILSATGGIGTPTGNYTFDVQRLAAASQQVTQGFSDSTTALGLSGTFTIQAGGKLLSDAASLTQLNGGTGVARGSIRITDASGASAQVDLSNAVDINDVIADLNSATGVQVTAKVDGDHLVLTDNSGGAGTLKVANIGGTTTASDLGLVGTGSGGTLTGTSLTKITSTTSLNSLNDGNGVRTNSLGDFTITGADGTAVTVGISTAKTIGDVIKAINTAGASHGISAAVSSDGSGITLTDSGGGPITVAASNGSLAAYDLGILGTSTGGALTGDHVASELVGPLLRDLNGGNQGTGGTLPQPGTITINGTSVDLSSARGLQDVINAINNSATGVTAAINDSGTGINLTSSSASFTVADGTGNLASFLHIAGTSTATATGSQISSGNLHTRYISNNTLLSTLNGGQGVTPGVIQITDGFGTTQKIDLTAKTITSIGDVINAINKSGLKVTASINNTGDGILLTQNGGTGTASVSDTNGGSEAAKLGIAGKFTNGTLDGSFQKSITVASSDSLSDIATKINNLGIGAAASIINDGSGSTPYRLNISSRNSGFNARIIFDGSAAGLSTTSLVQGQDAVVVYGGNSNGTGGLLTTSTTNAITGLIPSMTLNLTGVGTTSVSVTNDTSKITDAVQTFVTNYNGVINGIATATQFNQTNPAASGILFGNSTVQQMQDALGRFVNTSYSGYGPYSSLASIGITVNQDGTLSLDTDALNTALTTDPTDVQKLFTTNTAAVTGGAQTITSSTTLASIKSTTFPPGHISIIDGFGTAHDIDLSTVTTIADVISAINSGTGGTVTAAINSTSDGLTLTQVGGTGTAEVDEVGGGTTAGYFGIAGKLTSGSITGHFPPTLPSSAVKGIGAVLSDLASRFTDAQVGILFEASQAIQTQEQQLQDRSNSLSTLLSDKKNQLMTTFANLESTIAGLQSQGNALSSLSTITSSSSSSKKS